MLRTPKFFYSAEGMSLKRLLFVFVLLHVADARAETAWDVYSAIRLGDKSFVESTMTACMNDIRQQPLELRSKAAMEMQMPVHQVPAAFCHRMIDAVKSGKLPFKDFEAGWGRHYSKRGHDIAVGR